MSVYRGGEGGCILTHSLYNRESYCQIQLSETVVAGPRQTRGRVYIVVNVKELRVGATYGLPVRAETGNRESEHDDWLTKKTLSSRLTSIVWPLAHSEP